jgi:hypothetical protein
MAKRTWKDMSPRARRMIVAGAVFDGTLRIAALVDLARRPPNQIRGPKPAWVAALVLVNSAGAVPIGYFARGRRS